ncbi:MAG: type II secretion system F family protein [Candidatus Omnitrophica bacterium]|nr:type II secretion system F family protein [Candidatus Omnitrophota bacterium]
MALFLYVVKNREGKVIKGILEAESKEKLIEHFHKEGCVIFSIKETKSKAKLKTKGKIKADELVVFSRQFTTLIESGIPIVDCLLILKEQIQNLYFKDVMEAILKDVKEGLSLSSALSKHPKVFPEIYVSMVEAAEASGSLAEILDRLAIYLEKSLALRKKITSAMYYPVIVVLLASVITSFLVFKIIPTFKGIYESLGGKLPFITQMLINFSDFLRQNIFIIFFVFFLIVIGFQKYISTPKGKKNYHKFLLRLPVFGDLIKKIAIAKFARTFSTLIKSGVPIIKCLEIVGKTSGNKILEEAVFQAKKFIQEGQPISIPLEKTGIFPPMVTRMIAIGEKTGRLEEMLSKIAQFYEEQTDATVSGLSSLIEPIIILFLGIVVGGIVVALFLPIIKVTELLGR